MDCRTRATCPRAAIDLACDGHAAVGRESDKTHRAGRTQDLKVFPVWENDLEKKHPKVHVYNLARNTTVIQCADGADVGF